MQYLSQRKQKRKIEHQSLADFWDRWGDLTDHERRAHKAEFFARRREWEDLITACKQLTPGNRVVLRAIADRLDFRTGKATISVRTLARRCGTSPGAVFRATKGGESLGYLLVERQGFPGSHDACNVYTLTSGLEARSGLTLSPEESPPKEPMMVSSGLKTEVPQDSKQRSSGLSLSPNHFYQIESITDDPSAIAPVSSPVEASAVAASEGAPASAEESKEEGLAGKEGKDRKEGRTVRPSPEPRVETFLPAGTNGGCSAPPPPLASREPERITLSSSQIEWCAHRDDWEVAASQRGMGAWKRAALSAFSSSA
jgi:hypothetical protein